MLVQLLESELIGGRVAAHSLGVLLFQTDDESIEAAEVGADDVVYAVANGPVVDLLRVADQSVNEWNGEA